MQGTVTYPQCFVEIYPFEGGSYSIQGGTTGLLRCSTEKKFLTDIAGTFEIVLAPGGPFGPNAGLSWSDIITPLSFVLIGMRRKQYAQIVMIGVVTSVREVQQWQSGGPVNRGISISGLDFGYFYEMFSWAALTFLGTPASALGLAIGNPSAGIPAALGDALLGGPPDQAGKQWYTQVMDGGQGILSKTYVNFRGSPVTFQQAMATWFEAYPGLKIPYGINFLTSEGTWYEKFKRIFQYPWFEFFVITAPTGFYPQASGGYNFFMQALGPQITATPTMIARVNVLPYRKVSSDGSSFAAMDMSRWNALPLFNLIVGDDGLISTGTSFSENEVKNFYLLNNLWAKALTGYSNSSVTPFILNNPGYVDPASIHRYGFRPIMIETEYFTDYQGQQAQGTSQSQTDLTQLAGDLLARVFSYYEPTPLCMRTTLNMFLRPDIMPGCRFQYQPLKNEQPWTFYIDCVSHNFIFGGVAQTTLSLSRGLPTSVYNDSSTGGILANIHVGNAQRTNGNYQTGLPQGPSPDKPLESFTVASQGLQQALADMAQVYVTPQKK